MTDIPKTPAEAVARAKDYLHELIVSKPWADMVERGYGYGLDSDFQTRLVARQVINFARAHDLLDDAQLYVLLAAQMAFALTAMTKQYMDLVRMTPVPPFIVDKQPK